MGEENRWQNNLIHLGLLLAILLGYWLTIHHLDRFSFWLDEALTPRRAESSLLDVLRNVIYVQDEPTQDTHPQLYFLIIYFSQKLLGQSDFAYRYPSVLFFVLSLPLMARAAMLLFKSRVAGLIAAGLWAINPLNIWYGQEARMYTLLNLFGIVLIIFVWRAIMQVRHSDELDESILWRWFGLYAAVALLAGLTHVTAVFFCGRPWCYMGLSTVALHQNRSMACNRRRGSRIGHCAVSA